MLSSPTHSSTSSAGTVFTSLEYLARRHTCRETVLLALVHEVFHTHRGNRWAYMVSLQQTASSLTIRSGLLPSPLTIASCIFTPESILSFISQHELLSPFPLGRGEMTLGSHLCLEALETVNFTTSGGCRSTLGKQFKAPCHHL